MASPSAKAETTSRAIRLHADDNVVVALEDLAAGEVLEGHGITLAGPVPRGHKIATAPIAAGSRVFRYGQIIGAATCAIGPGEHVHTHNLGMGDHAQDYAFAAEARPLDMQVTPGRTFQGYHRADGKVGTRNYLGVLTSVNCSGSVARFIAEACDRQGWLA